MNIGKKQGVTKKEGISDVLGFGGALLYPSRRLQKKCTTDGRMAATPYYQLHLLNMLLFQWMGG
jgi:hypothetical protein